MPSLTLPINLNSNRNFQAFFTALEDGGVREGILKQKGVDAGVTQMVQLVTDKKFLSLANNVLKQFDTFKSAAAFGGDIAKPPPVGDTSKIEAAGAQVKDYLEKKYPAAFTLLKQYAETAKPRVINPRFTDVTLDVVANAEAVVNAAVYANAAAATNIIVAAEAIVVLAVFVL